MGPLIDEATASALVASGFIKSVENEITERA